MPNYAHVSFPKQVVATTNVNFVFDGAAATADAVVIRANARAVVLFLASGGTYDLGDNGPDHVFLPIPCTKATFQDAGTVLALKAP